MRVLGQHSTQRLQDHAQWLLQIGNNTVPSFGDVECAVSGGKWIKIPEHMRLDTEHALYTHVYGDLQNAANNPAAYFSERALMAPLNRYVAMLWNIQPIHVIITETCSKQTSAKLYQM